MKKILFVTLSVIFSIFYSCKNETSTNTNQNNRTSYFDASGMDSTVAAGDNFFLYANGKWMKNTKIPDDQTGWGSFYTLYEENLLKLKDIIDATSKSNSSKGTTEQKVADYYLSGMDTLTIEKLGAAPLLPMLKKIDATNSIKELMDLNITNYSEGGGDLLGFYVSADDKNSAMNIPIFTQSGVSLPEKEYYTRTDSATIAAKKGLTTLISRLLELTGVDKASADKKAMEQLALETIIATYHLKPEQLRDPIANYNKKALNDIDKMYPNVAFGSLFSKLNVKVDSVNIGQPKYFEGLNKLLLSQPLQLWKDKLKFAYIFSNASLLSKDFVNANFAFNKIINGQKEDSKRWKKMVNKVDRNMGDLLGQLYVKIHFTPAAKKRMDELVNNLQVAFEKRINKLDWMSDSTKARAITKLHTFMKKIGYPDKWKSFDDVKIDSKQYFENTKSCERHAFKEMADKIGKPVDRTEWGMSPPTVNAYYNASNNEIVFPAGILQFPFFDVNADDAINYGGIGMVIGHEMTHGFDDQGAQYDEKGNLENWWNKKDGIQFKSKTGAVVQQYNNFTVLNNLHLNGNLTLGENLADFGGLAIAYDAFKMTKQGKGAEKIDGFTPDQRFFLGYAQVWRIVNRDETMRSRITTDPHSPEMYRINGPAANFDPFYAAFNLKPTDKMYITPEKRAKVW
jgi:putative endopeptidase